jgi:hypothetical protein
MLITPRPPYKVTVVASRTGELKRVPEVLRSLLSQAFAGVLRVVLVDDDRHGREYVTCQRTRASTTSNG